MGTLHVHPDGYGFLIPDTKADPDVFIPPRGMMEAMHGDRVAVRIEAQGFERRRRGSVVRIVERSHKTIVGFYEPYRNVGIVIPTDPRLGREILIPAGSTSGAVKGQVVVAELTVFPSKARPAEGRVARILGDPDDPGIQTEVAIQTHGIPDEFPADVLAEAEALPKKVLPAQIENRRDLRRLPFVTIDGETARDFDDAVRVERIDHGRHRLYVAIADVSAYSMPGTALDTEAAARGNSTYFPDRAVPMFPEALSTGICSLNPDVERLAFVCEMVVGPGGTIDSTEIYEAVIRSRARLTYRQVHVWLEGSEKPEGEVAKLLPDLKAMQELATRLTEARVRRGSLDFDFPEAQIVLSIEGGVENVLKGERLPSHRLIEEFMLLANTAVATFLHKREHPALYRVHLKPDPEKVQRLADLLGSFGVFFPEERWDKPQAFRDLLKEVEGTAVSHLVGLLVLRSMMQARYEPDPLGHFGLALPLYAHFTSPIRRYPDLLVHRALKEALAGVKMSDKQKGEANDALRLSGAHCSLTERRSDEAERDAVDALKAGFMKDRIGESFDGTISGVASFGFFVEISDPFVEGLVRLTTLADDYYEFDESHHQLVGRNTKKRYRLGDPVRVTVMGVDLWRRRIEFSIEPEAGAKTGASRGPRPAPTPSKQQKPSEKRANAKGSSHRGGGIRGEKKKRR
jgi:ribonuclease R